MVIIYLGTVLVFSHHTQSPTASHLPAYQKIHLTPPKWTKPSGSPRKLSDMTVGWNTDISSTKEMGSALGRGGLETPGIWCKEQTRDQLRCVSCTTEPKPQSFLKCSPHTQNTAQSPGLAKITGLHNRQPLPIFGVLLTPGVLEKMLLCPASPFPGFCWAGRSLSDRCVMAANPQFGEEPKNCGYATRLQRHSSPSPEKRSSVCSTLRYIPANLRV